MNIDPSISLKKFLSKHLYPQFFRPASCQAVLTVFPHCPPRESPRKGAFAAVLRTAAVCPAKHALLRLLRHGMQNELRLYQIFFGARRRPPLRNGFAVFAERAKTAKGACPSAKTHKIFFKRAFTPRLCAPDGAQNMSPPFLLSERSASSSTSIGSSPNVSRRIFSLRSSSSRIR